MGAFIEFMKKGKSPIRALFSLKYSTGFPNLLLNTGQMKE